MTKCPKCSFSPVTGMYCGKCGFPVDKTSKPNTVEAPKAVKETTELEDVVTNKVDLDVLELKMKKSPHKPEAYLEYAKGLQSVGKLNKAFSTFRAAKTIAPDNPEVYRVGASILEQLQRKEEAIENYNKLLALKPGDMEAILNSSQLMYDTGRKENALKLLKVLQEKAGAHPDILIRIAKVYLSLGNAKDAQEQIQQYKRLSGNTREMYLMMGKTMLAREFFDGAVKNFQEGISVYPNEVNFKLGLGQAYLGMNEKGKALLEFEQALHIAPKEAGILLELGKLQSSMGMQEKAEATFKKIKDSNLSNGEWLLEIARHFSEKSAYSRALEFLDHAYKLSPHSKEIRQHLGSVLEKTKQYQEAFKVYLAAAKDIGNLPWIHEGIIRCADYTKSFGDKARSQKKLLEIKETADRWCDYGETLIRNGEFEEAEEAFEKAAMLDHTSVRAYQAPELIKIEKARAEGGKLVQQAKDAIENKFYLTAKERLGKALGLVPNEPDWLELLAFVSLKIAEIDKAGILLAKLRTQNPESYEFNFNLARIYESQGKIQLATEILASTLKEHPAKLEAHTMLIRLKRSQIRGSRAEREIIDAMIKNTQLELAHLRKQSNIPKLVEGYANYIFGFKTKFQNEYFNKAEMIFKKICEESVDDYEAIRGLSLIKRAEGSLKEAAEYIAELIKKSADSSSLGVLAKFHENFQHYGEALKCYESLIKLFPENGLYREKSIRMMAGLSKETGKNELVNMITERHKLLQNKSGDIWTLYEIALGQECLAETSSQKSEWSKRALLSWHKAVNHQDVNKWVNWSAISCQLSLMKGPEGRRSIDRNLKICEKLLRENPDDANAYYAAAKCCLAQNDLTQMDKAMKFLEKAHFIASDNVEIGLDLARTSKKMGKSVLVDFIGYHMVLFEPELASNIFRV